MSVRDDPTSAGFGGSFTWGERPAMVIVDLSRGFTDPGSPLVCDLDAVVATTASLTESAHTNGVPVAFTTIAYRRDLSDTGVWRRKVPALAALVEGSPLVEIDPRLPRDPDDPVFVKRGASGFHGTGLGAWLRRQRADCVVVAGASTSGCVRATVVDAVQEGWPTFVVPECTGDRDPAAHEATIFDMSLKYADLLEVTEAHRRFETRPRP